MSKDIKQATADKAEIIGEVFNLYRIFYKQKSNVDVAIKYIRERLDQKESIIFYIEDGDKCLGFTQLYPTFDSVNVRKKIVLYDLFIREEYRKKSITSEGVNGIICGFGGNSYILGIEAMAKLIYN